MKQPPTYDDANLILRLYELRRESKLRAARKWFASIPAFTSRNEFLELCPSGTSENAYFRMVTTYWEMAASLVAVGVLHPELFYRANNMELLLVWEKIRHMVPETRTANNNPRQYAQIEEIAQGFIEYLERTAPGYYQTFAGNVARAAKKPAAPSS